MTTTPQPTDGAIAQAYWELSNKTFDTPDDAWVFPVLRLISERAAEIDATRPAQLGGGVVSDAMVLRAMEAYNDFPRSSEGTLYLNGAIKAALLAALGKGGA